MMGLTEHPACGERDRVATSQGRGFAVDGGYDRQMDRYLYRTWGRNEPSKQMVPSGPQPKIFGRALLTEKYEDEGVPLRDHGGKTLTVLNNSSSPAAEDANGEIEQGSRKKDPRSVGPKDDGYPASFVDHGHVRDDSERHGSHVHNPIDVKVIFHRRKRSENRYRPVVKRVQEHVG